MPAIWIPLFPRSFRFPGQAQCPAAAAECLGPVHGACPRPGRHRFRGRDHPVLQPLPAHAERGGCHLFELLPRVHQHRQCPDRQSDRPGRTAAEDLPVGGHQPVQRLHRLQQRQRHHHLLQLLRQCGELRLTSG